MKYVWLVEDEKYGTQAVFATKRAAQKALANDRRSTLSPSGYGAAVIKMQVRTA